MSRRTEGSLVGALLGCLALSGLGPGELEAQFVVNGQGLSLTQFAVREKAGSSWVPVGTYQAGKEYRLTVRLTNQMPPVNTGGFPTGGCHVSWMTNVSFSIVMPGASFHTGSSYTTAGVTPQRVSGSNSVIIWDVTARLLNGRSQTYYAYFAWVGPPAPPTSMRPTVGIGSSRVCIADESPAMPVTPVG